MINSTEHTRPSGQLRVSSSSTRYRYLDRVNHTVSNPTRACARALQTYSQYPKAKPIEALSTPVADRTRARISLCNRVLSRAFFFSLSLYSAISLLLASFSRSFFYSLFLVQVTREHHRHAIFMFANSVISRSSISIFSLLLSSLPLPSLSLSHSLFAYNLFSLSMSCRLVSSSRLVLREQRVQSTSKSSLCVVASHPASPRSFPLFLFPSLFLCRPFVLPSLPPPLPPRLSFIYHAVRVSLFLALLFIDLSGEFALRVIDLNASYSPLSLSLQLFGKTSRSVEPIWSLLSRLFPRVNSNISG